MIKASCALHYHFAEKENSIVFYLSRQISCIKNNETNISFNLSLEIDTIKTRLKLELKSARLN